jgi:hypothetical protein
MLRSASTVAGTIALCLLVFPAAAAAKGKPGGGGGGGGGSGRGGSGPAGYDISYPQCGKPFPSSVLFGIVGVNDGIVYSPNPCLGTEKGASELAWAEQYDGTGGAILYANTADPGPTVSSHWPTGQTWNGNYCDPASLDSTACSYDYGWDAAADSYKDAVDAYIQLGQLSSVATSTPQPNEWWLDVESANSWESNTANDVAELQGEVDYLSKEEGVTSIGFYANASDWAAITGDTTSFAAYPYWEPGAGSESDATAFCNTTGVTGGPVAFGQYASGRFDADVRCS